MSEIVDRIVHLEDLLDRIESTQWHLLDLYLAYPRHMRDRWIAAYDRLTVKWDAIMAELQAIR